MRNDHLLTATELHAKLADPRLRIMDCRFDLQSPNAGRQEYLHAHIPGAIYADLDKDLAGPVNADTGRHPLPQVDAISEFLAAAGISDNTDVVVYDAASGALAARAWWLLRWLGHDRVRVLEGGMAAWTAAGLALQQDVIQAKRAVFHARPRPEMVLPLNEIIADEGRVSRTVLLDARDAARFRGEVEPIDAVAGHIPGARNLPFNAALDSGGRWKNRAELRAMLETALGDAADAGFGVMCGSGVTACHVALTALLAGYDEPRLYVGSWSEWIRDPQRPVATGGA